jgi:hypothetical protein
LGIKTQQVQGWEGLLDLTRPAEAAKHGENERKTVLDMNRC